MEKIQLYRHFAKDGTLLYVGISKSEVKRRKQHAGEAKWFSEINRVEIEEFENREAALAAEKAAILTERPVHNIESRRVLSKKADAKRQAKMRLKRRADGFKPHEIWAHPDDHERIKRFVERLAKRRNAK
jgi:predicted GIY-YIG superfamily endonuclease